MPTTAHKRVKLSDSQPRVDSISDIKARWKVTDDEYDGICNSFHNTLAEAGLLGERIQGRKTQLALAQAIEKMLQKRQHQSTFERTDTDTMRHDL